VGEEHVRSQGYQFRYIGLYAVRIASGKTIVDVDVATLHPTKVPKPFAKCRDAGLSFQIILGNSQQHTNPPRTLALLRARRQGPRRRRAADERDELAASHSITSSARASSVSGTVRPRAFAVLRLITSSYFVGA